MKKYFKSAAILIGVNLVLAGCSGPIATHDDAVHSIKTASQNDTLVADGWSATESGGLVDDGWVVSFNDPQLIKLVDEAEKKQFWFKNIRS